MASEASQKPRDEDSAAGDSAPGTPSSQSVTAASSPMDHDTLLAAVRKQVEYYFSKENLERDAYLTSQMDASHSVPISVVMKFSKMKSLLKGDESILREALNNSTVCPISEDNRIRALVKSGGRSTIILREIPADTPEAAVREIFNFDAMKSRNITSIRSDIENTWFVELDSETDAKDTLLDLKLKRRLFNGESVKARLKTEVAVRSFYSQPPPVAVPPIGAYGQVPMSPYGGYGPNGSAVAVPPGGGGVFGYPPQMIQQIDPSLLALGSGTPLLPDGSRSNSSYGTPEGGAHGDGGSKAQRGSNRGKYQDNERNASSGRVSQGQQTAQGGRGSHESNTRVSQGTGSHGVNQTQGGRSKGSPNSRPGGGAERQAGGVASRGQAKSGKGGNNTKGGVNGTHVPVPVDLNLQNFPPLHVDETPIPTAGYQSPYVKYSADDIITIVSKVKDAPIPLYALNGKPLNPAEHGHAMTSTPNMDLLRRQRSFSIDETREQLQQGKPVQREAVAAGAVDYESMIYGDHRSGSIDETGLRDAIVSSVPSGEPSKNNAAPGSAQRSRSNSYQHPGGSRNHSKHQSSQGEQARGAKAVPSASTWASLVKSSSSCSTQTEPVKGALSPPRVTKMVSKSDSKISGNTSNNKGTFATDGEERSAGAKEGKRSANQATKESKNKATNNTRKKDGKDDGTAGGSSGWGGKSTFANILKKQGEGEATTTSSIGTQSEFSEMTVRGNRTRTSSKDKVGAAGTAKSSAERRQPSTITTEADGSWAKKTFS